MNHLPGQSNTGGRRNSGGRKSLSNKKDLEDELFGDPQAVAADAKLKSDNQELYKEELRVKSQLQLERSLLLETAMRLGVYDSCPSLRVSKTTPAESDEDYEYEYDIDEPYPFESECEDNYETTSVTPKNKLQLARNKLRLSNLTIHPCIVKGRQGKTVTGTLEVHANGFRYKNYGIPFELDIMFHNVNYAFFQDGDEKIAPLCHLHLHNAILVGTEMTKDVQFRMVETFKGKNITCLVRDSDAFKKEHQKHRDNNEVMRDFLSRVDPICLRSNSFGFAEVEKKYGFYGDMILKEDLTLRTTFVFMFTCLVQLEHMPFAVIILSEIEIVNLVLVGSGKEMFNMTIVFKDFKRDVIQINSIPSTELINIKETLDASVVKYYESNDSENELDIPLWRSLLQYITENPKTFIENGGWDFLNSGKFINLAKLFQQDPSEITYYSDIEPGQESDSRKKNLPLTVTTRTMPVGKRVMVSSDESECDLVPKVKEKEVKHTARGARRKLVKKVRRRMVMSSDGEE